MGVPLIGKFSTARWVWARHNAVRGTRTSPMESRSMRKSSSPWLLTSSTLPPVPGPDGGRSTGRADGVALADLSSEGWCPGGAAVTTVEA